MNMKKIFLTGIMCFSFLPSALACTLFGATGIKVDGGGTLVAKNRDWKPTYQEVRLVTPPDGYRYYALMTGKNYNFNAGGINEKGLFVAMSTAGSIPKKERDAYPKFKTKDGRRANDYILQHYGSVLAVLDSNAKIWSEPVNVILADKDGMAMIEVQPGGIRSLFYQENGVVYHTNHYVYPRAAKSNVKIGPSSLTRYNRIKQLMTEQIGKFHVSDFWTISKDQTAGMDNSIFRLGSKIKGTRTVAELVAQLPKDGNFTMEVDYLPNPTTETWKTKTITAKDFQKS